MAFKNGKWVSESTTAQAERSYAYRPPARVKALPAEGDFDTPNGPLMVYAPQGVRRHGHSYANYTGVETTLRFSKYAWSKLKGLCYGGPTEVGCYAITREDDLAYVEDLLVPDQVCTIGHVSFDQSSTSDLLLDQVEKGVMVNRCQRIWIHTHPWGCGPHPSGVDENTFREKMGGMDWAMMFIMSCEGEVYCRLRTTNTVTVTALLPVAYEEGLDHDAYEEGQELYRAHVTERKYEDTYGTRWGRREGTKSDGDTDRGGPVPRHDDDHWDDWQPYG